MPVVPLAGSGVPTQVLGGLAGASVPERAVLAAGCAFTVADARAPDLPLVSVNPAFTAMTGYSEQASLGRNCRFLQGPDTDPVAVSRLRDAIATCTSVTVVLLNYRLDGEPFWNEIALSPVQDVHGVLTHLVGVQFDVTDRVVAERLAEQALKTEHDARVDAEQARADAEQARVDAEQARQVAEDAVLAAGLARAEADIARAQAERARSAAELAAGRLVLLSEVTSVLAETLDVEQALDRLAGLVVPALADWVVITLATQDGRLGDRTFVRHRDGREELVERYQALVPSGVRPNGVLQALLAGAPPSYVAAFTAPDPLSLTDRERQVRQISLDLGSTSLMFVPLTARRRVVGTLMLVHGVSGRVFTQADLDLAADLGRRAGLAVDNADLYARLGQTALTLQRSLLPALPSVPGLALAAEYLPAARDAQVGGDWWDVFVLPDGATGVAIGDVMGHDIAAAAAMGQLRSVLRTCAWLGDPPQTVLDRMDQLVQGFDMAQLATCLYARIEPADPLGQGHRRVARLFWSNAGHLPPVLLDPDGRAHLLRDGGSVPLGVPAVDERTRADVAMPAGSTLLLYTDGLVETRAGDIETDLAGLLDAVGQHDPHDGAQALVERLVDGLGSDLSDDVALLAVQLP